MIKIYCPSNRCGTFVDLLLGGGEGGGGGDKEIKSGVISFGIKSKKLLIPSANKIRSLQIGNYNRACTWKQKL